MIQDSEMNKGDLLAELDSLRKRLSETEETLAAIREGQIDALVVDTDKGIQVFTLEGAEQTYRILFEQMNESAVTFTGEGVILFCNRSFSLAVGVPHEKIIGTRIQSHVSPGTRSDFANTLEMCREGSCRGEVSLIGPNDTEVPVLISVSTFLEGELSCYCMVATNLTERRRAEEILRKAHAELENKVKERTSALSRSNEDLQRFAYVASHDLQEPLRTISGYLGLLEREYRGTQLDEQAEQYIRFAIDGTNRMYNLIQDLLDYSRITSRARPFEPLRMERALEVTLEDLGPSIKESGAVITHDPLPEVTADRHQMVRLLLNLIGNAIKFRGEETPAVHISCERQGSEWVFSIKDNGIGIPKNHAATIFEMFRRLHSVDKYPGTGIGLSIARRIVERHGGRIWLESTVGSGSTFFFTLPVGGDAGHWESDQADLSTYS